MKIEKKGFTYRGLFLGQDVYLKNIDKYSKIIGFDTKESDDKKLSVLVKLENKIGHTINQYSYSDHFIILTGEEDSYFYWYSVDSLINNKNK